MHSQPHKIGSAPSTSRAFSVAQQAVDALGRGYDATRDLWLNLCKVSERLITDDQCSSSHDLYLPGNIVVPNAPASVKCDKGERAYLTTDVLTFNEMSERFNQDLAIPGKIPLGHFNSIFNFSGAWQKDASAVKTLAMTGVFIDLYSLELRRTKLALNEEIKKAVPSSWEPAAFASFVEKYGTHVIVGIKIGGKDLVCVRQNSPSSLPAAGVQKVMEEKSKERFSAAEGNLFEERNNKGKTINGSTPGSNRVNAYMDGQKNVPFSRVGFSEPLDLPDNVTVIFKRKGGMESSQNHQEWLKSVPSAPDIVSMSLVPISSLLTGVTGGGFLSHAINLYLRYKPSIHEFHYFLEFQLPKEWAPAFGDLPLGPTRRQNGSPSLQFRPLGPKLQINTIPVVVGKRCVTGARLHLEGKKGNRLAIHLQHLTVSPQILRYAWEENQPEIWIGPQPDFGKYFLPVMWKSFSHVCTAPVFFADDYDNDVKDVNTPAKSAFIVTGAQLDVEQHGSKKVLFLKLLYSRIKGAKARRNDWDDDPAFQQKSGIFSTFMSAPFSTVLTPQKPDAVVLNSGIAVGPPPASSQAPKLFRFVDTTEMTRGPIDSPGHWLVTGGKLSVYQGKIAVRCNYSLLFYNLDETDM